MSFAPKNILVPVDVDPAGDRPLADRLVDDACLLAKQLGAKLTLLHVAVPVTPLLTPPIDLMSEAYRAMLDVAEARNAASSRSLQELQARAAAAGIEARVRLTNRPGSVPEVILEHAKEEAADLIVLTTHGRRGLNRLLLGSVAERTAHLSRIPVLLLPPA